MTLFLTKLGAKAPVLMNRFAARGICETMSISRTAKARGAMGGSSTSGATTTAYSNVPVSVEVDKKGGRIDFQGKPIALQTYILEFPVTQNGSYIDIDISTDKFIVNARSPIPARTYKIQCPADDCKVVNRYVCTEEF